MHGQQNIKKENKNILLKTAAYTTVPIKLRVEY